MHCAPAQVPCNFVLWKGLRWAVQKDFVKTPKILAVNFGLFERQGNADEDPQGLELSQENMEER